MTEADTMVAASREIADLVNAREQAKAECINPASINLLHNLSINIEGELSYEFIGSQVFGTRYGRFKDEGAKYMSGLVKLARAGLITDLGEGIKINPQGVEFLDLHKEVVLGVNKQE